MIPLRFSYEVITFMRDYLFLNFRQLYIFLKDSTSIFYLLEVKSVILAVTMMI